MKRFILVLCCLTIAFIVGCQDGNHDIENVNVDIHDQNEAAQNNGDLATEESILDESDFETYMLKMSNLDQVFSQFSLKTIGYHSTDDTFEITVRKTDDPRIELTDNEKAALKEAVYDELGETFPLNIETYVIGEDPTLMGIIVDMEKDRPAVLIVDDREFIEGNEDRPDAHWTGISKHTILKDKDGNKLVYEDLKIGQSVVGWHEMMVFTSYPGQTGAVELIVDTSAPIEPDLTGEITKVERIDDPDWELIQITINDDLVECIVSDETWIWDEEQSLLEKETLREGLQVDLWTTRLTALEERQTVSQMIIKESK